MVVQSASQGSSGGSSGGLSGTLSCSGLEQLWTSAGGNPADAFMAAEIAMAESGGNQYALSPTDDYGYWQINAQQRLARHVQRLRQRAVRDHPLGRRQQLERLDHLPHRRLRGPLLTSRPAP